MPQLTATLVVLLLTAHVTAFTATDIAPTINDIFSNIAENRKSDSQKNYNVQNPLAFTFLTDVVSTYACYIVKNEDKEAFTKGNSGGYTFADNSAARLCPNVATYPNYTNSQYSQLAFGIDLFNSTNYDLIQSSIQKKVVTLGESEIINTYDIVTTMFSPLANGFLSSAVNLGSYLEPKFGSMLDLIDLSIVVGEYTSAQQILDTDFNSTHVLASLKTMRFKFIFSVNTFKQDVELYRTTLAPAMLADLKVTVVLIRSSAAYTGASFALLIVLTLLMQ